METILLNLTRGTGMDGLAGIPVRNGDVIRPLLFASRKEIEKYAVTKGLVWREDLSNQTDDYQRNFIRHQIIPRMKELNPSLQTTWQGGLEKVKGEISFLHHAYEEWKIKFVKESTDRIEIDKVGFELYSDNPALVWRCCRPFGFNFDQAKDILLALHGQPGKRFISHTHMMVIDRQFVIITDRLRHWEETIVEKEQSESFLGPWHLTIEHDADSSELLDARSAMFDKDRLTFPLKWRKWKAGDSFHPLGMEHKKKLSDFFIDMKLSRADKDRVTVLESDGTIVWVAGYRIDDRFKLTSGTKSRIVLRISQS